MSIDMSYLDSLLPDFEPVDVAGTGRIVANIWGDKKTGKSSLALSFPTPLIPHNFDYGMAELLAKRPELVPYTRMKNHQMTELTDPATWGKLLEDFQESYSRSLAAAEATGGTVIVDTATQLWQIVQSVLIEDVRSAKLAKAEARTYHNEKARADAIERAEKPSQMDYGKANAYMGGLLRRAMHTKRASAVFIYRCKDVYSQGGQKTGEIAYHGFAEAPAITQVQLHTFKKGGDYYARVDACRFDGSLEGMNLKNPTFDKLLALLPAAFAPAEDPENIRGLQQTEDD